MGAAALLLLGGTLVYAVRYEPAYYTQSFAERRSPKVRLEEAQVFEQTSLQLFNDFRFEDRWSREISEDSVNSWLAEILPVKFGALLPREIQEPRVKFETGQLLLAFRVYSGMMRGVVNCRVRIWAPAPNQLALDLQTTRLGLIPVPIDDLIGLLVKELKSQGTQVEWRNSEGNDVLVVNLSPKELGDDANISSIESIELTPGVLRITGGKGASPEKSAEVAHDQIR